MFGAESLESNDSSLINLGSYSDDSFSIHGFTLTSILDNMLLARYVDLTKDGKSIVRNGIHIPINTVQKAWRLAEVVMCGENVKALTPGDYICFPNDKGIPVSNLQVECKFFTGTIEDAIFLDESRIFGTCKKIKPVNESKSTKSKKRSSGKRS